MLADSVALTRQSVDGRASRTDENRVGGTDFVVNLLNVVVDVAPAIDVVVGRADCSVQSSRGTQQPDDNQRLHRPIPPSRSLARSLSVFFRVTICVRRRESTERTETILPGRCSRLVVCPPTLARLSRR